MSWHRKTVDLCQDCWQAINPTEYYPEAVRYDECYGCGDTRLVIRTPRLGILGYAEPECWLDSNGWGEAGYMDNGQEQASECATLRGVETCPVHHR
jgi:hypothetical protein